LSPSYKFVNKTELTLTLLDQCTGIEKGPSESAPKMGTPAVVAAFARLESIDYNDCIAIKWSARMSSITVRNLDESVKNGLRIRAARHGWSMEQEVRQILQQVVAPEQAGQVSFAQRIQNRFAGLQAESLPIPARQGVRTPPVLDNP